MGKSSVLIDMELHFAMKQIALERKVTVRSLYESVVRQFLRANKKVNINKEAE
jgi:hypothetical protein